MENKLKLSFKDLLLFLGYVTNEANKRKHCGFSSLDIKGSLEQEFLERIFRELAKRLVIFVARKANYTSSKVFQLTDAEQYALLIVSYKPDLLEVRRRMAVDEVRDHCLKAYMSKLKK